ncbi:anthranilate synthase component I family protein [Geovibrio thiophilus]|uniref:Anthranilate synthase component I family protein n=1 Tax=Geovibrio thiophilus TaxID=139438 RepID=A0A410K0C0_9BACT|nr:chorismate-binding protein [Geovibrio thiophilus]QAR33823.1 anthranilate synthase component I family protein [Geovibrio thiophilus]
MRWENELIRRLAAKYRTDIICSNDECACCIEPCAVLEITESTGINEIKDFAFSGEAAGFLSYDYGMILRGVKSAKERSFPLGMLKKYSAKIVFAQNGITGDTDLLKDLPPSPQHKHISLGNRITSSADKNVYMQRCERTLEEIRSGNTYQLNYAVAHSFRDPLFEPLNEFFRLTGDSPAAFAAYFDAGRYKILSSSPERFIKADNGLILSQPIKGTLRTENEGLTDAHRLTENPKECAELAMIIDMIRNDIGISSRLGSVEVSGFKSVFRINSLLQMYGNVTGELREDADVIDLLLDAFPGGSVTGCPKKRSMEIIDSLEPFMRGIYCGSIFRIGGEKNMDSSICIRTGVYDTSEKTFTFYSGSGIVTDSEPPSEYNETMSKTEKFMEVFG